MPFPQCLKIHYLHHSNLTMKPVSQQCKSFFSSGHYRTLQLHFFFSFFFFCIVYKPANIWRRDLCLSQRSRITQLICWFSYRHYKLSCLQFARWNHFPFVIEPGSSPCVRWDLLGIVSLSDHAQMVWKQIKISGKKVWVVRNWPDPRIPFCSGIPTPSKHSRVMFSRKKGNLGTSSLSFTKIGVDKMR